MRRSTASTNGYTMVFFVVTAVPLIGFAALAVDFGRVVVARAELATLCDAAARYAITGIGDDTALAKANAVASQSAIDGGAFTFSRSDVDVGRWDPATRTFTPGPVGATAVRVTARRTKANGNPIPLVIGGAIGLDALDVNAEAIAQLQVTGYGVVGLDWISMSGNSSDSYWPGGGSRPTGQWGSVASNGNIGLSGSSHIDGDANPGMNGLVYGANHVSGSTARLKAPLNFPNGDAGDAIINNDDDNVPSSFSSASSFKVGSNQSLVLPGGTYYANNINISGSLTFTGPTTVYCYGSLTLNGRANTSANLPRNLTIVMCPGPTGAAPGSVTISSSSSLYASIYAPQSAVFLSGTGDIYGSVLGKSVAMSGTSSIHYDLSLNASNGKRTRQVSDRRSFCTRCCSTERAVAENAKRAASSRGPFA